MNTSVCKLLLGFAFAFVATDAASEAGRDAFPVTIRTIPYRRAIIKAARQGCVDCSAQCPGYDLMKTSKCGEIEHVVDRKSRTPTPSSNPTFPPHPKTANIRALLGRAHKPTGVEERILLSHRDTLF